MNENITIVEDKDIVMLDVQKQISIINYMLKCIYDVLKWPIVFYAVILAASYFLDKVC